MEKLRNWPLKAFLTASKLTAVTRLAVEGIKFLRSSRELA